MIRLLQGNVHSRDERSIILFTNGVGYQVHVSNDLLEENDESLTLFIHTHIREDEMTLYGFRSKKELNFFELVLTINGIGPRMAMAILNEPPDQIQAAILNGDLSVLTKISGVGKKIAQRICLELKNKVDPLALDTAAQKPRIENNLSEDAILTLENLGYKRNHIQSVFNKIDHDIKEAEDLIRYFLQNV